jgi:hypothetical protein
MRRFKQFPFFVIALLVLYRRAEQASEDARFARISFQTAVLRRRPATIRGQNDAARAGRPWRPANSSFVGHGLLRLKASVAMGEESQ